MVINIFPEAEFLNNWYEGQTDEARIKVTQQLVAEFAKHNFKALVPELNTAKGDILLELKLTIERAVVEILADYVERPDLLKHSISHTAFRKELRERLNSMIDAAINDQIRNAIAAKLATSDMTDLINRGIERQIDNRVANAFKAHLDRFNAALSAATLTTTVE